MKLSYVTVDVFTSTPYYGNPVAIVKVSTSNSTILTQEKRQLIAREFNFSETVFLHEQSPSDAQAGIVSINIFTPWAEINFAGHPTIGTTNYLLRYLKQDFRTLVTRAGACPVSLSPTGQGVSLEIAHNVHVHAQPFQHATLGRFPVVSIVKGMSFILANLSDLSVLAQQTKNFRENSYVLDGLLDEGWNEGLLATYCYVDLGADEVGTRQLRTRCLSMREDPATGSAASALTSYLALQGMGEGNGDGVSKVVRFVVTQGVEMGRKSEIGVEVTTQEGQDRWNVKKVVLSGTAVQVMEGSLEVN